MVAVCVLLLLSVLLVGVVRLRAAHKRTADEEVEMAWDELTQRVINKMSDGYSLQVRHLLMIMNLFKGIVS